jgi:DNA-binding transcriptional LysR family regulator
VTKPKPVPATPAEPPHHGTPPAIRFELAELETFLAVVELGSFSQAARRLNISQPSATSRVQRLEATLRCKLLVRNTRHLAPTPEGTRLFETASKLLGGLRDLLSDFQVSAEADRHRVLVGTTPVIAGTLLPRIIRQYSQRYTDVQVELMDLPFPRVLEAVEAGTVQFGIMALDGGHDKIDFQPLAEEELFLIVPTNHALASQSVVTLDQLTRHPLMVLARYSVLHQQLRHEYESRGHRFAPVELANLGTLLGMIDAGNGIAFLPKSMLHLGSHPGCVALRVADVKLMRRYGIATSRKTRLSAAAESFRAFVEAEFANALALNLPREV